MPTLFTISVLWLIDTAAIIAVDLVRKTRRDMRRQRILQQLGAEVQHAA